MGVRWRSRCGTPSYHRSVSTQGWIQSLWTTQKVLSLRKEDVGREGIDHVLALANLHNNSIRNTILFRWIFINFVYICTFNVLSAAFSKENMWFYVLWIWSRFKRINAFMCVFAVAGVIYVCIHSATKVIASDYGGLSDPYCVVFSDRRRVRVISLFIPIKLR